MLPDGTGYLVKSSMPTLASTETYQLWGIVKGSPVSIGVMGAKPGHVTFTMDSSPAPVGVGGHGAKGRRVIDAGQELRRLGSGRRFLRNFPDEGYSASSSRSSLSSCWCAGAGAGSSAGGIVVCRRPSSQRNAEPTLPGG